MKVKATQLGYMGLKRKYPGEVFDIPEKLFSSRWMEKVDGSFVDEKPAKRGRPPKVQPQEEVEVSSSEDVI